MTRPGWEIAPLNEPRKTKTLYELIAANGELLSIISDLVRANKMLLDSASKNMTFRNAAEREAWKAIRVTVARMADK